MPVPGSRSSSLASLSNSMTPKFPEQNLGAANPFLPSHWVPDSFTRVPAPSPSVLAQEKPQNPRAVTGPRNWGSPAPRGIPVPGTSHSSCRERHALGTGPRGSFLHLASRAPSGRRGGSRLHRPAGLSLGNNRLPPRAGSGHSGSEGRKGKAVAHRPGKHAPSGPAEGPSPP